jgi:hypothetical protein
MCIRVLSRLLIFLFVIAGAAAQNQNTPGSEQTLFPLSFQSVRANGMGGTHAALADDFDTIFVNPAGFSSFEEDTRAFAAISTTINDFDTIFSLIRSENMTAINLADLIKNRFAAGFDIGGPFRTGYISDGFGIGFLNHQYVKVWWERNDILHVQANIVEEIAVIAGHSFPIENFEQSVTFTPGFSIKPLFRFVFTPRNILLTEFRYIFENMKQEPFEFQAGIGIDAGMLVNFSDFFYIGAVIHDVLAPLYVIRYQDFTSFSNADSPVSQGVEFIKQTYDLSFCFRTRDTFLNETITDIVVAVDYRGLSNVINGIDRNPLLDVGIGLEVQLVRALWLRVGWQQMLIGGGLGIDLGWGKFDFALFGETFGDDLDSFQSLSFSVGLTVAF